MLRMHGITKSYGSVRANLGIDLVVPPRRIVGLLGENGSGKTTLMNILFGMVRPDAGTISVHDRLLVRHSPREAIAAGIGMIHQHFMLVPAMTVTENVMLGWEAVGRWLRPAGIAAQIRTASAAYGLDLDPDALVGTLPLGLQQRVEIVKAILRGAELLILDEPTSSLSPPEVAGLLAIPDGCARRAGPSSSSPTSSGRSSRSATRSSCCATAWWWGARRWGRSPGRSSPA